MLIFLAIANIDKLQIVDMGNGGGLEQMSSVVPNTVFKTLAAAKAQGIDITKLLNFIGVDIQAALKMVGSEASKPATK